MFAIKKSFKQNMSSAHEGGAFTYMLACQRLHATQQANIDDANCQAAGAKFGSRGYAMSAFGG
jgi:hypothetical protein